MRYSRCASWGATRFGRRGLLRAGFGLGAAAALGRSAIGPVSARAQQATPVAGEAAAIVTDVLDFQLDNGGRWPGHFGSVTLKLHQGFFDGGDVWFIRTDASDATFASENGLVYVPLLRNALTKEGSYAHLYVFRNGADGQRPVVSTVPTREDFTPAFRVHIVSFTKDPVLLESVAAIREAETAGTVQVEATEIVVNYPLVRWPGGGLPVDTELKEYLGKGPLVEEPDTAGGSVTFKLHQCYPGSRYFVTDTSAVPMAPMMAVAASPATQALIEAKATAPIYVFGNGLPGPGPMGFQPSVFNSTAGDPVWSPFWEHMTVVWKDPSRAVVLKSEADIKAREAAGDITVYKGVPETDPMSFVVNCPSPVLARPDYDPAEFQALATPPA